MSLMSTFASNPAAAVSLFGAIIAACGAFVAARQQDEAQRAAEVAQREVTEKTEEITRLATKIADIAQKNSELNEKIAGLATGGDSFAVLSLGISDEPTKAKRFPVVVHQGEFPLYDVEMRIVDLIDFRSRDQHTLEQANRLRFEVGNISPGDFKALTNISVDISAEGQEYNVFFKARNGSWVQKIWVFKTASGVFDYQTETKRFRGDAEELIYKEVRADGEEPQIFSNNGKVLTTTD